MLPTPKNYAIYPQVVPTNKKVQMVIAPTERAFLLFEGEEYTVTVIPVAADVPQRGEPDHHTVLTLTAKDGVLKFDYTFDEEEEYTVLLAKDKPLAKLSLYALDEDLYPLTPMRGDLHLHSYRSDGSHDPAAQLGNYREQGFDFMTLSDHNRYYPGGEIDEVYKDVKLGITHVQGEEIHVPGTPIHIVGVGHKWSVAEKYIENSEEYQKEMAEYKASVPAHVPAKYADRYAMAKWSTDNIRKAGGVAIFPHPFWLPGDSKAFNVNDELSEIFLTDGLFDAYELIGGMSQSYNNRSVAFWMELRAKGVNIPVVGSSDVHNVYKSAEFPHRFTVAFSKSAEESDIMDAVKNGLSLAVESEGTEYDRTYRAYGSLRLVSYGRFLLENYFPALQRVCQGEGVAMRSYAMGDAPAALIELQAEQTRKFKDTFFGRREPTLPSASIIDFENRWRARHMEGPITKGSLIYSDKVSRQI